MIETFFSALGNTPLTSTGCTLPLCVNIPCSCVKGATATTSGCCNTCSPVCCQSSKGVKELTVACGTMPKMRVRNSRSKPFITDKTKIITNTPKAKPTMEVKEIKEIK